MRFSICIEMFFPELGFCKRLSAIRAAGFDTVEFWSPYDKDLQAFHQEVQRLGLQVALFSGHRNHSPVLAQDLDGFLAEIEGNAQTEKRLGCHRLMVLGDALQPDGSAKPADLSHRQKRENLLNALEKAARIAAQGGLELCLEPLNLKDHPGNFLHQSEAAFEVVEILNHPNLKVLFDIYHMQRSQGHIIETIQTHLDHIGYFHAADVPGRVEPGSGELNYPNIFRAIERMGFSGTVGFECRPQGDANKALEHIGALIAPFAAG